MGIGLGGLAVRVGGERAGAPGEADAAEAVGDGGISASHQAMRKRPTMPKEMNVVSLEEKPRARAAAATKSQTFRRVSRKRHIEMTRARSKTRVRTSFLMKRLK